jgi:class 3 adenylate cyclase/tetratricopeptide (TPR) repeat protein
MGSNHCTDCGHRVSAHARFCERCGAALRPSAEPLRAPSTLEAKILARRTAIEGEHKQVTVMYTDVVGSMELTRSLDNERWGFVLDRFLALTAAAVHGFEGTVSHFTGDGLLAVFGAPLAHEDHARRACLAVLELQAGMAELAAEVARTDGVDFSIRCGLNSGEVVVGEIGDDVHMDFVPVGNTTALGKRIESLAPVGSAAISASTAALVEGEFELRDLGEFEVKGAEAPQRVLELVGPSEARTRLEAAAATRGLARFVGREDERAELESALEHALAGRGRAVAIVGDPGVGKSRLVHEFVAGCAARGVAVNSSGCVSHGRHVPFLPLLALYRDYFGVGERDSREIARERIETTLVALDPTFATDLPLLFELFGVSDPEQELAQLEPEVRQRRLPALLTRAIEARSRHEAAVLVIEDLHWIDGASAAFLETLVEAVVGTRTVLVTTFRPEYEAAWTSSELHALLSLEPLDSDAAGDLLTELLGNDTSIARLSGLIENRTGGNPFFIEEVVQALRDAGHLTGARGDYRLAAELDRLVLPPTVQAALAARIDGLPTREKALVQTMSVIGAEIPAPLLSEVSELGQREVAEAVAALTSAQMVVTLDRRGEAEYAFKHPLTQDVAYQSQLSERRARAHREVAHAIERVYADGLDERAALLAHHYEASRDKLEAAGWHARAARWARGVAPAESMRRWRRVRDLARDLESSPEADELAAEARIGILHEAWRLGLTPEETAAIRVEAGAGGDQLLSDPHYAGFLMHSGHELQGLEGFRDVSRQAIVAADPGRILTASMGVAYASWIAGSLSEAVETLDHALALANGDRMLGSGLAFVCPLAFAYGHRGQCAGYMGELDAARHYFGRGADLAREHDDPETESHGHANLALLEAEVGEFDAALRNAGAGLAIAERMGNVIGMVASSTAAALAQAGSGRFADALAQAESDLTTIRERQIGRYYEPLLLATIARSKLALGAPGDALAAAEEAVEIMDARRLAACALRAPITLAQVLIATQGAAARERIDLVLSRALDVARASGARVFEPQIHRVRG